MPFFRPGNTHGLPGVRDRPANTSAAWRGIATIRAPVFALRSRSSSCSRSTCSKRGLCRESDSATLRTLAKINRPFIGLSSRLECGIAIIDGQFILARALTSLEQAVRRNMGKRAFTRLVIATVVKSQETKGQPDMTPFILQGATRIPPEPPPTAEHIYDAQLQIWMDRRTGVPVVISNVHVDATRFGETTITETQEGADQPEVQLLRASSFGETTVTKTAEGVDQSEATSLSASRFGETTVTATVEGLDRPEIVSAVDFDTDAPYSHF